MRALGDAAILVQKSPPATVATGARVSGHYDNFVITVVGVASSSANKLLLQILHAFGSEKV